MKRIIAALFALGALMAAAIAAPPTAEQKAKFYKVCAQRGAADLCTCKAEAAMKIVDHDFMDVIIASMSGKSLDPKYNVAYSDYIVESTRACGMGM
jgi:hypothetical protein